MNWILTATTVLNDLVPAQSSNGIMLYGRISGVILVLSALLFLWNGWTRMQRENHGPAYRWFLFAGILVMPVPILFIGNTAALISSQNSEFCGSCHTMDPFFNDMKNPASELLASKHYNNKYIHGKECYVCHTGYGYSGTILAKVHGLWHSVKYYTNTYKLPIKLYSEKFDISRCAGCHNTPKFASIPDHVDKATLAGFKTGEASCFDCHNTAHPAGETRSK